MKLKELLNDPQYEAAVHKDGPMLILAGAGSGKTRVITYRIANLIANNEVKPENILAVTFTNRAAAEMRQRITKVVGQKAAKDIWMSTFHSLGAKLLRRHAERLGYTKAFSIFDEDDRERLTKECMHEAKITEKEMKPYAIIKNISDSKNRLFNAVEAEAVAKTYEEKLTARVYKIYEERLMKNNAMDFDDLILQAVRLLDENPDLLEQYAEKFRYIMIDEYQDINNSQYTLVSLLAEKYKNLCVVGDDDQSIYRFRGADITNILGFEEDYPKAKVIRLEQNYRSTKNILLAAYSVIKNNKDRKDKAIWTDAAAGALITFYYADDEILEAEFIAKEVIRLRDIDPNQLKDIAIFYRTNAQSRVIEDKFRRANIWYKLIGGLSFYGRLEIKDMLAYLKIISNPHDMISLKRIINVPPREISETTYKKLQTYTFENDVTFFEAMENIEKFEDLKPMAKNAVKKFYNIIKNLNAKKESIPLSDLLKELIAEINYLSYWQNDSSPKASDRVENVKELVSAIAQFEKENPGTKLEDFLNQVTLMTDFDKWDKDDNRVTLMTMHSAKGLEFETVFIAGMDDTLIPHKNCVEEPGGIEEERRLCYVGITRARKKLFLLSAFSRSQFGSKKLSTISRFMDEIPQEVLEHKGRIPAKQLQEKLDDYHNEKNNGPVLAELEAEPEYMEAPFKIGDKVRHTKLGDGMVLKVERYGDDVKVTVAFKTSGRKELSMKYAKLKKL